jgi:hypothetical protein
MFEKIKDKLLISYLKYSFPYYFSPSLFSKNRFSMILHNTLNKIIIFFLKPTTEDNNQISSELNTKKQILSINVEDTIGKLLTKEGKEFAICLIVSKGLTDNPEYVNTAVGNYIRNKDYKSAIDIAKKYNLKEIIDKCTPQILPKLDNELMRNHIKNKNWLLALEIAEKINDKKSIKEIKSKGLRYYEKNCEFDKSDSIIDGSYKRFNIYQRVYIIYHYKRIFKQVKELSKDKMFLPKSWYIKCIEKYEIDDNKFKPDFLKAGHLSARIGEHKRAFENYKKADDRLAIIFAAKKGLKEDADQLYKNKIKFFESREYFGDASNLAAEYGDEKAVKYFTRKEYLKRGIPPDSYDPFLSLYDNNLQGIHSLYKIFNFLKRGNSFEEVLEWLNEDKRERLLNLKSEILGWYSQFLENEQALKKKKIEEFKESYLTLFLSDINNGLFESAACLAEESGDTSNALRCYDLVIQKSQKEGNYEKCAEFAEKKGDSSLSSHFYEKAAEKVNKKSYFFVVLLKQAAEQAEKAGEIDRMKKLFNKVMIAYEKLGIFSSAVEIAIKLGDKEMEEIYSKLRDL